ncbi:MAG: post-transcriptional regulator [Bacilli bacterium]|nr:post-transcriptional regulator [Bacilli bacterium]
MEIKIEDKLPLDILFLMRVKAHEFKKEGVHTIDVNDIKDYLYEVKWRNQKAIDMCEMIDDIMSLNFSTLFDYLKFKVIKEASTLKIEDFNDLISK